MLVITIAAIKTRAIPASNCFFFFEPLKLYILFTSLTKSVIIELLFRLLVHFIYDDIEGDIEIIQYIKGSNPKLKIRYKNNEDYISITTFIYYY